MVCVGLGPLAPQACWGHESWPRPVSIPGEAQGVRSAQHTSALAQPLPWEPWQASRPQTGSPQGRRAQDTHPLLNLLLVPGVPACACLWGECSKTGMGTALAIVGGQLIWAGALLGLGGPWGHRGDRAVLGSSDLARGIRRTGLTGAPLCQPQVPKFRSLRWLGCSGWKGPMGPKG